MALSKEEVLHVAKLARLEFSPEEIEKYQQELNDILNYIDMLNEVDAAEIKPLVSSSSRCGEAGSTGISLRIVSSSGSSSWVSTILLKRSASAPSP